MNARETLDELAHFLDEERLELEAVTVAKAPTPGAPPEARVLSLADDAAEYFSEVIDDAVGDRLRPLTFRLRRLDPVYKPDPNDLEWEPLT
ncbi:MAG: hypothetical protein ACJ768_20585, partial [Gaiellaceae bacterium]